MLAPTQFKCDSITCCSFDATRSSSFDRASGFTLTASKESAWIAWTVWTPAAACNGIFNYQPTMCVWEDSTLEGEEYHKRVNIDSVLVQDHFAQISTKFIDLIFMRPKCQSVVTLYSLPFVRHVSQVTDGIIHSSSSSSIPGPIVAFFIVLLLRAFRIWWGWVNTKNHKYEIRLTNPFLFFSGLVSS